MEEAPQGQPDQNESHPLQTISQCETYQPHWSMLIMDDVQIETAGNLLGKRNPLDIPHSKHGSKVWHQPMCANLTSVLSCFAYWNHTQPWNLHRISTPEPASREFELALLGKECWSIDTMGFGLYLSLMSTGIVQHSALNQSTNTFMTHRSAASQCEASISRSQTFHPSPAKLFICHQPFILLVPGRWSCWLLWGAQSLWELVWDTSRFVTWHLFPLSVYRSIYIPTNLVIYLSI